MSKLAIKNRISAVQNGECALTLAPLNGEQPMPFDQLEQKEATGFLLRIVGTLPLRQQEVIQLKFQSNKSSHLVREI